MFCWGTPLTHHNATELRGLKREEWHAMTRLSVLVGHAGRIGSTNLDNGQHGADLRVFLRKYGRVAPPVGGKDMPVALRFHKYVEIDPTTQREFGINIYFIPPTKKESPPQPQEPLQPLQSPLSRPSKLKSMAWPVRMQVDGASPGDTNPLSFVGDMVIGRGEQPFPATISAPKVHSLPSPSRCCQLTRRVTFSSVARACEDRLLWQHARLTPVTSPHLTARSSPSNITRKTPHPLLILQGNTLIPL